MRHGLSFGHGSRKLYETSQISTAKRTTSNSKSEDARRYEVRPFTVNGSGADFIAFCDAFFCYT